MLSAPPARTSRLATVLSLAMLSACATSDFASSEPLRPARGAPDRFLVGSMTGTETREPVPGKGCGSPMVDPRDGTRLTLVRSGEGQGDYEVPHGRFGVGRKELLRLDCSTGAVIGIVTP